MTIPNNQACCTACATAQTSTVPRWSANCLAAQPDLAPCEVRREFADQSLGRVTVEYTLVAGTGPLVASEVVLPGFAAAAQVCFRAVTMTVDGVANTVDIVRLAPIRLYKEPDGSWVSARGDWESEQTSLASATSGRCACAVVCAGCVPPTLGWMVRFEHAEVPIDVGADQVIRFVIEYKATSIAPCCDILTRCGEPLVTPVVYGDAPVYRPEF